MMKILLFLFSTALLTSATAFSEKPLASPTLPYRHETAPPDAPPTDTLLLIKGGTFAMGSNDDQSDASPVHQVTISDFYLTATEVTNARYCAFLNEKGNQSEGGVAWLDLGGKYEQEKCRIQQLGNRFLVENGYDHHPVTYVSWYGAQAYCEWLTVKSGDKRPYRLPTEAEWEYAATGGKGTERSTWAGASEEAQLSRYANFCDNKCNEFWKQTSQTDGYAYLAPVGQLQSNALGLFDMSGNVQEWCSDRYDADYYQKSPPKNPTGPATGAYRVVRGGGWNDHPQACRADRRDNEIPTGRNPNLGFRVAR